MKRPYIVLFLLLIILSVLFIAAQADIPDNANAPSSQRLSVATFAGGCFWCTESEFEKLQGVHSVISGYTGGSKKNPSYRQVARGKTSHQESVQVHYDPALISYEKLLQAFWRMINPTDAGGQFYDRGHQYSTAIFYHSEDQRRLAEQSIVQLESSGRYDKPIVTPVVAAGVFYPAEDYHQDYYKHNPVRYKVYRWNSGRDQYLKKIWGKELTLEAQQTQ